MVLAFLQIWLFHWEEPIRPNPAKCSGAANHLATCLTLSKSLSLRHSNHLCVIYSWPFGEQKECNMANPQPIRRQNWSDRQRCWEIFAWLWTCVLAGKGSDVFLTSVGILIGFFLLFMWALTTLVLLSPRCSCSALPSWQHVACRRQDCFRNRLGQMASLLGCYGCQGSALKQVSLPFSLQCICDFRLSTLYETCVFCVFSPLCHTEPPQPWNARYHYTCPYLSCAKMVLKGSRAKDCQSSHSFKHPCDHLISIFNLFPLVKEPSKSCT